MFNPLACVQRLEESGFTNKQATVQTEILSEVVSTLASKEDLNALEGRLDAKIDKFENKLESKISVLDERITRVETVLTTKINGVETALTAKINGVESALTAKISAVDNKINSLIGLVSLIGVVLTTLNLLHNFFPH